MAIVRTVSSYQDLKEALLFYIQEYNKMDALRLSDSWLFYYMTEFLFFGKSISKNDSPILFNLTKTILVEDRFDSSPYSKDYFHYYASITEPPEKLTRRIHFFKEAFDENDFWDPIVSKSDNKLLDDHYLGYLIVKPIVNTFVGCTFFYPKFLLEDCKNVFLPGIGEFKISLFGKSINLTGLPFQEQDGDISVCATNALWSSFYKLNQIFESVPIPSPTEIQFAAGPFRDGSRTIPSSQGLTIGQVSNAISYFGLTSELREWNLLETSNSNNSIHKNKDLKQFIYAYLKMGIPILLGFKQFQSEKESKEYFSDQPGYVFLNNVEDVESTIQKDTSVNYNNKLGNEQLHLVTVVGFETFTAENFSTGNHPENDDYLSNSDHISALICHNDTLGPYSRLVFSASNEYLLEIEYPGMDPVEATTQNVLVPIVEEIKITFENISRITRHLDVVVKNEALDFPDHTFQLKNPDDLVWEIFLNKTSSYKEEIASFDGLSDIQKIGVLEFSMPKYIWVSRLMNKTNGRILLEIIYNATESPSAFFCFHVFYFNENFKEYFLDRLAIMVKDYLRIEMSEIDKPAGKLNEIPNPLIDIYLDFFRNQSTTLSPNPKLG